MWPSLQNWNKFTHFPGKNRPEVDFYWKQFLRLVCLIAVANLLNARRAFRILLHRVGLPLNVNSKNTNYT
jgi:hypothetical protein